MSMLHCEMPELPLTGCRCKEMGKSAAIVGMAEDLIIQQAVSMWNLNRGQVRAVYRRSDEVKSYSGGINTDVINVQNMEREKDCERDKKKLEER